MEDKPKLRPVEAVPLKAEGEQLIYLRDPSGLSHNTVALSPRAFFLAALCDGEHTLREIQAAYVRRFGDLIYLERIEELLRQLDEALLLEGERIESHRRKVLEEYTASPVRKPIHAGGAYPDSPDALRAMLDELFLAADGPGEIDHTKAGTAVVAAAAPHIDLRRGGITFAHAYKHLAERCPAETFVILGTLHQQAKNLFVLTDKDFETPLGIMPCDRDFTHELMRRAGLQRDEDEIIHRTEHSVEFQAIFLQYAFGPTRKVKIVPVLCGPILEAVGDNPNPLELEPLGRFVNALRDLLREAGDRAAVIASVDLSHVGRRFGDPISLSPGLLSTIQAQDRELLKHSEEMDAAGFFENNRDDKDRRHVCGFPALYTLLSSITAKRGQLLHYAQAPEEKTQSVVTFAAMVFER